MQVEELKSKLTEIIDTTNDVLEELTKAKPNKIIIMDLAIERLDQLMIGVEGAIFGEHFPINKSNAAIPLID